MKKIITILLTLVMAFSCSLVGCGPNQNQYGDVTVITYQHQDGGIGGEWVKRAAARFEEKMADHSYEEGKKGVHIDVQLIGVVSLNNFDSSAINIADVHSMSDLQGSVREGILLNLDDVMTSLTEDYRNGEPCSIEDKVPEEHRGRFKGASGDYYAVPGLEFYQGCAYDIDTFDRNGLYFANDDAANYITFYSEVLQKEFKFIDGAYEQYGEDTLNEEDKTCGPNGIVGDYDDGLPSSVHELIALCEYMSKEKSVAPFLYTGQYDSYSTQLLAGLMASLLGYERAQNLQTFEGAEMEIVTGFYDEPLFVGHPQIKKPKTALVNVNQENGYYNYWTVERYYTEAFLALAFAQNWFHDGCTDANLSQKMAMSDFIFNGFFTNQNNQIGMLIESSFWYNEAILGGYIDMFNNLYEASYIHSFDRRFGFMPLPIDFDKSVNYGEIEGEYPTYTEMWHNMIVVNSNIKDEPGLVQACKDFLSFLCTDSEASKFSAVAGIRRSFDYELKAEDANDVDPYVTYLLEASENAKVVYYGADNPTFRNAQSIITQFYGTNYYLTYKNKQLVTAFKEGSISDSTIHKVFAETAITKQGWEAYYAGDNSVTDNGYTSIPV